MKVKFPIIYENAKGRVVADQTFYEITSVVSVYKGETYIHSGFDRFMCLMPIEEVEWLIDKAKRDAILSELCN
jgi:hypothetical protein